jgi:uncharacterized protein YhbP (UPF0306 family)
LQRFALSIEFVMDTGLVRRIESFLASQHVMSLATFDPKGPHATSLFFACDGLGLVWLSDPVSRHSQQIEADPRVAATVAPDCFDFSAIHGVQITGTARQVFSADQQTRHLGQLEARYPFLRQLANWPPKLRESYARSAVYRLQPTSIVLIDNSQSFGHKETLKVHE